ncbi:hypothetical protein [Rhodanobacter sp. FW106-PBR-LB-2-11]|uniref:hypothetical protein n=1 Tax=Rhodanobacter sp. FW106-PBR-LB-2-11 TaxID=1524463 RepID=UPI0034E4E23E
MSKGILKGLVLVAGLACAAAAFADGTTAPATPGPQNAKEQQLVEHMQAAYRQRGLTLTPEREEALLQQYRQMQARAADAQAMSEVGGDLTPAQRVKLAMGLPTDQAAATTQVSQPEAPTADAQGNPADQLLAAVHARHAQGAPTDFEWRPDGFVADGKSVVDPEGRIVQWDGDGLSGDVTYLVQVAAGQFDVRFTNTHSTLPPITVGSLYIDPTGQHFTSVDGQTVSGRILIPTSKGIVMARDTAIFDYEFGKPVVSQALPPQYMVATFQRGPVGTTNYVLLKRYISQAERHDPIEGVKGLFNIVRGKVTSNDFALFNIKTGHAVYLAIDEPGTGGSIWNRDGRANYQHYFWQIDWMPNPKGATAVVLENQFRDLNAIRLDSGERINVRHRAMGIERFNVYPLANGSFGISDSGTKLGTRMQDEAVDINTLFANEEAVRPKSGTDTAAATGSR